MKKMTLIFLALLTGCVSSVAFSDITPYLVDTNVGGGDGLSFSNNAVLYAKGSQSAYGKYFNPNDLSEQTYFIQGQSGWNHFSFDMQPNGAGYMVFSGKNESLFYRYVDPSFTVGAIQYPIYQSYHNWSPVVSGDNFIWIWAPGPYTNWDLKVQNLITNVSTTLAGGPGNQGYSSNGWHDIWQDNVVYADESGVYTKQIWTSNQATLITAEDGSSLKLWGSNGGYIYNNKIAMLGDDGKSVYMYEIGKTDKAKLVFTNDWVIDSYYYYDDLLVWSDKRNGTLDIFGLYLSDIGAVPFQVTHDATTDEKYAQVYNGKIVWQQSVPGAYRGNLYIAEIQRTSVPIPSTIWLLSYGLALLVRMNAVRRNPRRG